MPTVAVDVADRVATITLDRPEHLNSYSIRMKDDLVAALNRQLLWRMLASADPMDAHLAESRAMVLRGASADCAEGVGAFLEKRSPVFTQTVPADLPEVFHT